MSREKSAVFHDALVSFRDSKIERDVIINLFKFRTPEETLHYMEHFRQRLAEDLIAGGALGRPGLAEQLKQSLWETVAGDRIQKFEMAVHFKALHDFVSGEIEAVTAAMVCSDSPLDELDDYLRRRIFDAERDSNGAAPALRRLRAVLLVVGLRWGAAAEELVLALEGGAQDAATMTLAAEAQMRSGCHELAEGRLLAAIELLDPDKNSRELALIYNNLGACCELKFESEDAVRFYETALAFVRKAPPESLTDLIEALLLNNLGFSLLTIAGEPLDARVLEDAQGMLEEALKLRREAHDVAPNIATTLLNLAELHRLRGDNATALEYADRANGAIERFKKPHILKASISNARGLLQLTYNDAAGAFEAFRQARTILEANHCENDVRWIATTSNIAVAEARLGRFEDALHTFQRARALTLKVNCPPVLVDFIDSQVLNMGVPPAKLSTGPLH